MPALAGAVKWGPCAKRQAGWKRPKQHAPPPESGLRGARQNDRMPQQPELSSIPTSPAPQPPAAGTTQPAPQVPQRIPRWLERAELFLRVLLRLYIGLAVCYAPWSRVFWDDNPLFLRYPTLGSIAVHGAVRGIVSGLGVLNLWFAFRDAIGGRGR